MSPGDCMVKRSLRYFRHCMKIDGSAELRVLEFKNFSILTGSMETMARSVEYSIPRGGMARLYGAADFEETALPPSAQNEAGRFPGLSTQKLPHCQLETEPGLDGPDFQLCCSQRPRSSNIDPYWFCAWYDQRLTSHEQVIPHLPNGYG